MIVDKTNTEFDYFALIKQGKAVLADGYYIGNNKLMFVEPISNNCKWDRENRVWIDNRTLEEQLEYYKQEILNANRKLLVYEKAGFANKELQVKLNKLIKKHNEISFDIASEENKFF